MNPIAEDVLMHYGVKKRSGRYPWGSGDSPYQHSGDFLSRVEELQKLGYGEKKLAEELGLSTTDLRMQVRVAKHERRQLEADKARSMRDDGKSLNEIAEALGYSNDSSVRSLLNESTATNKNRAKVTADILREKVNNGKMLDVGVGVERELDISQNTLKEALFILETEGYQVRGVGIPQPTNPTKRTITEVLTTPEIEYKYIFDHTGEIQPVRDYHSTDGGLTYDKLQYPQSISSDRVHIQYGDQGGANKDGVIEIRRGVPDLDLGNSHYAQVRILVDGKRYLKGMAMYSDDIPEGSDIVFNTNKKSDIPKDEVMKPIKSDPDNPFGAAIKANGQSYYDDPNGSFTDPVTGKKRSLSAINKLKEEGDWDSMSRNLSSQFLSKQPVQLIKKQLNLTYADKADELSEINSLTNPTIKRKMLMDFANECDGAVVHLKSAALPRQSTQVILPITTLSESEIYAPNYKNGEQVALVRYPHGGTFEIPVLTVNNKNASARDILSENIRDAVGINPKVAERLSGADFDGDQVVVIPTNENVKIKSTPKLRGLADFDAKVQYAIPEGNPNHVSVMTKANTQKQMGMISNLITDMTLKGAPESEIVRAVRHSMVVIDAEKHKLDYKQSARDNGIAELKKKWQGYTNDEGKEIGGASTLLSRRKQDIQVAERKGSGRIDENGNVIFSESGRKYVKLVKSKDPDTGEVSYIKSDILVPAKTKVKLLNFVSDARTLSSGTPQENAYADYANKMKALANQARKDYLAAGRLKYSASAKEAYAAEVSHLESMLNVALKNAPKERLANAIANSEVKAKLQANPDMAKDKKEVKKASQMAVFKARNSVGASGTETKISISDREWEAIQAGAITDTKLTQILRYADADSLKQRAMPRTSTQLSPTKVARIKTLAAAGYTNAQIAEAIGKSSSTVSKYISN